MRPRRPLRAWLAALEIALLGACWTSCSSGSSGAGAANDAGGDGGATSADSTLLDDSGCDPCAGVCPCTFGDSFFNTGKCETVTCGPSGMWGGSCLGVGCPEDAGPDVYDPNCNPCSQVCACVPGNWFYDSLACTRVTCGASGVWGGPGTCMGNGCTDAGADVVADVVNEAAQPAEASTD
jgi:hypothetical protein